jgi:hypothetical protein
MSITFLSSHVVELVDFSGRKSTVVDADVVDEAVENYFL